MRFSKFLIAFFMVAGTVTQGPVLTNHVTEHSLERSVGHSSRVELTEVSNPECDFCHAYQIQNSILQVPVVLLSALTVAIKAPALPITSFSRLSSTFFRARAPPYLS